MLRTCSSNELTSAAVKILYVHSWLDVKSSCAYPPLHNSLKDTGLTWWSERTLELGGPALLLIVISWSRVSWLTVLGRSLFIAPLDLPCALPSGFIFPMSLRGMQDTTTSPPSQMKKQSECSWLDQLTLWDLSPLHPSLETPLGFSRKLSHCTLYHLQRRLRVPGWALRFRGVFLSDTFPAYVKWPGCLLLDSIFAWRIFRCDFSLHFCCCCCCYCLFFGLQILV